MIDFPVVDDSHSSHQHPRIASHVTRKGDSEQDKQVLDGLQQQTLEQQHQQHEQQQQKLTPYQRRKLKLNILSRMLKSDVRRDYPLMFVNVMNSGNASYLAHFFSTYAVPQCSLTDHPHGHSMHRVYGHQRMVDLLLSIHELYPDIYGEIVECRIARWVDRLESTLVVSVCLRGTKVTQGLVSPVDLLVTNTFHLDVSNRIADMVVVGRPYTASDQRLIQSQSGR